MHECQEIWSANINQKEDRFLIYERDLINKVESITHQNKYLSDRFKKVVE